MDGHLAFKRGHFNGAFKGGDGEYLTIGGNGDWLH